MQNNYIYIITYKKKVIFKEAYIYYIELTKILGIVYIMLVFIIINIVFPYI